MEVPYCAILSSALTGEMHTTVFNASSLNPVRIALSNIFLLSNKLMNNEEEKKKSNGCHYFVAHGYVFCCFIAQNDKVYKIFTVMIKHNAIL